jgi:hypothetical protein
VKAHFVTSILICGLPMGTPWLLVSDDASIFCERKKQLNNKYLYDKYPLFPVFHIPPRMHARATAAPLCFSRRVKAFTRLIHTWGFRIWIHIDQKVILGHFFLNSNLRPEFKSQGARTILLFLILFALMVLSFTIT